MTDVLKTVLSNLIGYDGLIIVLAVLNFFCVYLPCRQNAERVYGHFNGKDHVSNLAEKQKKAFFSAAKEDKELTVQDLLNCREITNRFYAMFTNFTSLFPLLGMLGTVIALISMVNKSGFDVSGAFFGALTSTFWGIVCAIIFKIFDATISYKIDDNEKHLEYLFNPDKGK